MEIEMLKLIGIDLDNKAAFRGERNSIPWDNLITAVINKVAVCLFRSKSCLDNNDRNRMQQIG